jgi:hypothetical protein
MRVFYQSRTGVDNDFRARPAGEGRKKRAPQAVTADGALIQAESRPLAGP